MAKSKSSAVTPSSGNVFADLGLPNAEELGTKVRLAASVNAILARRKLTQAAAAKVLGVNQPKVSALKGYKVRGSLRAADALCDPAAAGCGDRDSSAGESRGGGISRNGD